MTNILYYCNMLKIREMGLYVLSLQLSCKSKIITWKRPKCPSTDAWMKKMLYVQWNIIQP